ncbi:hypothetical protein, partial [Bacillus cereus]|uniref:hypothetical protein n=1 Tax=Bacillus cereus TaxID=1396 RepID=UPI001962835E
WKLAAAVKRAAKAAQTSAERARALADGLEAHSAAAHDAAVSAYEVAALSRNCGVEIAAQAAACAASDQAELAAACA